jgi:hypothetical protein
LVSHEERIKRRKKKDYLSLFFTKGITKFFTDQSEISAEKIPAINVKKLLGGKVVVIGDEAFKELFHFP